LVTLLRLQLGDSIGGVARNVFDLDAMLGFKVREQLLTHGLLEGTAVAGDNEGLVLRARRRHDGEQPCKQGDGCAGWCRAGPLRKAEPSRGVGSPCPGASLAKDGAPWHAARARSQCRGRTVPRSHPGSPLMAGSQAFHSRLRSSNAFRGTAL